MDYFVKWLALVGFVFATGIGGYVGTRIGMYLHLRKCFKRGQIGDHFYYLLRTCSLNEIYKAWDHFYR